MTDHPQRVFLSYTAEDLSEFAGGVAAELRKYGHEPVDHTDWAASGSPSVQACRESVAGCTMLVVLVAHRYGWVPGPKDGGDGERSITWLEVEEARRVGIPVLPFLVNEEKADWPVRHIEGLRDPTALRRLDRFREQLRGNICGFFSSQEALIRDVVRAVETRASRAVRGPRQAHEARTADEYGTYRRRLERLPRRVKFLGFGEQFQVSLPISELWVPLRASVPRSFAAEEMADHDRKAFHAEAVRVTKVEDAFRRASEYGLRGIVLLGDPGSGKTTAVRRMAWQCADLVQGPASLGLPGDVVPVLLRLRELPKEEVALGLEPMLRRQLASIDLSDEEGFGDRLLARGRVLWMLDGIDEVASPEARGAVSGWIRGAVERRPEDWFLVTSRYAGYEEDARLGDDFLVMHVNLLTSDERRDFVSRWYRTVERQIVGDPEAHALASERSSALLSVLEGPDFSAIRLASMAANPLLLSILCIVHRRDMDLPKRRADLYAKCIDVLLDSWRHEWRRLQGRGAVDAGARLVLQSLAWSLHQEDSRTDAEIGDLVPVVREAFDRLSGARDGDRDPRSFLETIHKDSGLLVSAQPGRYAFLHLTFQEYLVARHCVETAREKELASHFAMPWWNEPILLALSMAPNDTFVEGFFEAVFEAGRVRDDESRRFLEWCVRDALILPKRPFLERLKDERTPAELLRVLVRLFRDSKDAYLAREARAVDERMRKEDVRSAREAAHIVGTDLVETQVDDRTGILLVQVPAGSFMMGRRFQADETPVRRVQLGGFWLAAHPVTNAQYERFLRATGHDAPAHWTDSNYNAPGQPVVGISWDDAQAYCKWSGLVLPSEAQWEYACRAGTTTEYWSGNEDSDLGRVGWYSKNSGGQLHAVGEKPANPWGLHDMHGNVWEWCEDTWHANYEGAPTDGRAWVDTGPGSRVYRGGSWNDVARYARSSYRDRYDPGSRNTALGVRPARAVTAK